MRSKQLEHLAGQIVQNGAYGCLVIVVTEHGVATVPRVSEQRGNPEWTAKLMLVNHLKHVQDTAERAGLDMTLEEIAEESIREYRAAVADERINNAERFE